MSKRLTRSTHARIAKVLANVKLPQGIGGEHDGNGMLSACSIAAINLALTGELIDEIPDCMSEKLGRWIIYVQDTMGDTERNAYAWRVLLPDAAGTRGTDEAAMFEAILQTLLSHVEAVHANVGEEVRSSWEAQLNELLARLRNHIETNEWTDAWACLAGVYSCLSGFEGSAGVATEALGKALTAGYALVEDEERTPDEIREDEFADAFWTAWLADPIRPNDQDEDPEDYEWDYDDE